MLRALVVSVVGLSLAACATTVPNRDPSGQRFPDLVGTSLAGERTALRPASRADERGPRVLLVGYTQRAQFDIDRWLLGLAQADTPVRGLEVPAIAGWWPGLFADRIDAGMRRGIPEEDWPSVVTLYDGADRIVALTGNERPDNARVLLLDRDGRVVFFHDAGYSTASLLALDAKARSLSAAPSGSSPPRSSSNADASATRTGTGTP